MVDYRGRDGHARKQVNPTFHDALRCNWQNPHPEASVPVGLQYRQRTPAPLRGKTRQSCRGNHPQGYRENPAPRVSIPPPTRLRWSAIAVSAASIKETTVLVAAHALDGLVRKARTHQPRDAIPLLSPGGLIIGGFRYMVFEMADRWWTVTVDLRGPMPVRECPWEIEGGHIRDRSRDSTRYRSRISLAALRSPGYPRIGDARSGP